MKFSTQRSSSCHHHRSRISSMLSTTVAVTLFHLVVAVLTVVHAEQVHQTSDDGIILQSCTSNLECATGRCYQTRGGENSGTCQCHPITHAGCIESGLLCDDSPTAVDAYPMCVVPGTLANNEVCRTDTDCVSRICYRSSTILTNPMICKSCRAAQCDDDDNDNTASTTPTLSTTTATNEIDTTSTNPPPLPLNSPCKTGSECSSGRCLSGSQIIVPNDTSTVGVCVCATDADCSNGEMICSNDPLAFDGLPECRTVTTEATTLLDDEEEEECQIGSNVGCNTPDEICIQETNYVTQKTINICVLDNVGLGGSCRSSIQCQQDLICHLDLISFFVNNDDGEAQDDAGVCTCSVLGRPISTTTTTEEEDVPLQILWTSIGCDIDDDESFCSISFRESNNNNIDGSSSPPPQCMSITNTIDLPIQSTCATDSNCNSNHCYYAGGGAPPTTTASGTSTMTIGECTCNVETNQGCADDKVCVLSNNVDTGGFVPTCTNSDGSNNLPTPTTTTDVVTQPIPLPIDTTTDNFECDVMTNDGCIANTELCIRESNFFTGTTVTMCVDAAVQVGGSCRSSIQCDTTNGYTCYRISNSIPVQTPPPGVCTCNVVVASKNTDDNNNNNSNNNNDESGSMVLLSTGCRTTDENASFCSTEPTFRDGFPVCISTADTIGLPLFASCVTDSNCETNTCYYAITTMTSDDTTNTDMVMIVGQCTCNIETNQGCINNEICSSGVNGPVCRTGATTPTTPSPVQQQQTTTRAPVQSPPISLPTQIPAVQSPPVSLPTQIPAVQSPSTGSGGGNMECDATSNDGCNDETQVCIRSDDDSDVFFTMCVGNNIQRNGPCFATTQCADDKLTCGRKASSSGSSSTSNVNDADPIPVPSGICTCSVILSQLLARSDTNDAVNSWVSLGCDNNDEMFCSVEDDVAGLMGYSYCYNVMNTTNLPFTAACVQDSNCQSGYCYYPPGVDDIVTAIDLPDGRVVGRCGCNSETNFGCQGGSQCIFPFNFEQPTCIDDGSIVVGDGEDSTADPVLVTESPVTPPTTVVQSPVVTQPVDQPIEPPISDITTNSGVGAIGDDCEDDDNCASGRCFTGNDQSSSCQCNALNNIGCRNGLTCSDTSISFGGRPQCIVDNFMNRIVGSFCVNDSDCGTNRCFVQQDGTRRCRCNSNVATSSGCGVDQLCIEDAAMRNGEPTCIDQADTGLLIVGSACSNDDECISKKCTITDSETQQTCTCDDTNNRGCLDSEICRIYDTTGSPLCFPISYKNGALALGLPCTGNDDCASGRCYTHNGDAQQQTCRCDSTTNSGCDGGLECSDAPVEFGGKPVCTRTDSFVRGSTISAVTVQNGPDRITSSAVAPFLSIGAKLFVATALCMVMFG